MPLPHSLAWLEIPELNVDLFPPWPQSSWGLELLPAQRKEPTGTSGWQIE